MPDVIGRAQALDDPRATAGLLDDDELAGLHREPRAPPERQLIAILEERARDQKASSPLDRAGDEPRPAFLVAHR